MTTNNVFTNVYGMARSLLALGTLLTLTFCNKADLFPETVFSDAKNAKLDITNFNLFFIFNYENLSIPYIIAIIILIAVISGYFPFITGLAHAWVSYSFFTCSFIIEGGDQITQILTLLILPITLLDKRLNHWGNKEFLKYKSPAFTDYFAKTVFQIISLQMSVLYFFAGSDKLNVLEWKNGSALYYWFNHNLFGANNIILSMFTPIVNNPYISPLLNWAVILLEILLFGAIFMNEKQRLRLLPWGISFHFLIFLVHGLPTFFLAMTAGLILYLVPPNKFIGNTYFLFPRRWFSKNLISSPIK
ncbi:sporulation-delaying protein SdpB family protein [Sphingobacterium sp.]|uniref:sporulation-delaying protein SdpB family protein n=1 Tax=Sphingobacterium sp. TaxID=341027 RepID=UPI0025867C12|nr:sporulation-delaying protein SdpB family protein [Sphingobacterium sp.]WET67879.1 MAG: hypothetical protein P0Y57_18735 [Sphingobacterium sp.]